MVLTPFQLQIAKALREHPFYSAIPPIPVVTEVEGDYESEIERVVGAGGMGICALVLVVEAKGAQNQIKGEIWFNGIELRVRSLTDPALNKTGVSAWDLAEVNEMILRGVKPLGNKDSELHFQGIQRAEDFAAPVAVDATFQAEGGWPRSVPVRPQLNAVKQVVRDDQSQPVPQA